MASKQMSKSLFNSRNPMYRHPCLPTPFLHKLPQETMYVFPSLTGFLDRSFSLQLDKVIHCLTPGLSFAPTHSEEVGLGF